MAQAEFWRSTNDPEREMSARVMHWQDQAAEPRTEQLSVEEPFEVRLGGQSLAVIMRTPGHDIELALGFLYTEGIIAGYDDVVSISAANDTDSLPLPNVVDVVLREQLQSQEQTARLQSAFARHFAVSASCGLCGKNSIADLMVQTPALVDDVRIVASALYALPGRLRDAQAVFAHTGGLHASGLFTATGELLLLREDIGRHNAVDKIVGHGLQRAAFPYPSHILMVSGRTSFEIIQKALLARIPCIAAISAPSSLAVELAERAGITLIGFLRGRSMNIYTHAERIIE